MIVRRIAVLWLFVVACGPGELRPDADDDGRDGDDPPGGLELRWTAPDLGRQIDAVVIDDVRLYVRDLRVVGDAAGDLTYRATQEIQLDGGSEPVTELHEAPPGRYSALEFRLAGSTGNDDAWEMQGEVEIDPDLYDLQIDDDAPSSVSLPLALDLAPGETAAIEVRLDLAAVFEGIDFSMEEPREEGITIDEESPLLPILRARLLAAFSIGSIDSID